MIDIFKNYELQREELLARIAQSLQLDRTRKKRMEDAYSAIAQILNDDLGFFNDIDVDVYPQGSTAIGTSVKPLHGNEFDLDIVVHIKKLYSFFEPQEIYNELLKILELDGRYKDKISRKNRCVRLNYSGDFHMDILPGCITSHDFDKNIRVPDRKLKTWTDSNPKGFAELFLSKANSVKRPVLSELYKQILEFKAEIQELPDDEFYIKTPLQRSVQLVKRYRDIYFEGNDQYSTSSIVLTTLIMNYYNGENSIYSTIDNALLHIKNEYSASISQKHRFKVLNPVNPEEDFADGWSEKHFSFFFEFINDFYNKWQQLKHEFKKSGPEFVKLFGEGIYKESLRDQIKIMGKFSSNPTTISNSLIISESAYTNPKGQIQESYGYKNEKHHNFGV